MRKVLEPEEEGVRAADILQGVSYPVAQGLGQGGLKLDGEGREAEA